MLPEFAVSLADQVVPEVHRRAARVRYHERPSGARGRSLVWGVICQGLLVLLECFFILGRVSAQSADAMPSHTDWERGRVKADSREAGAR